MKTLALVYAAFVIALIFFNLLGNSLVCFLIIKNKTMRTSLNWLSFYLAVADLLVAVFFVYPCILNAFLKQPSGVTGEILCKFVTEGTLGWAAASTSSFLLVAVAFERYFATLYPFRSLNRRRPRWFLPFFSILGILLVIPLMTVLYFDEKTGKCMRKWPSHMSPKVFSASWSLCNSMIPICIMGYLYARIVWHLRNDAFPPGSSRMQMAKSRAKVTKMLITVSVIYISCWCPQVALCLLSEVVPGGYTTVYLVSTVSALLNSCVNPVIYSLHSRQFRRNLASLCCKNKRHHAAERTNRATSCELKLSFSRCRTETRRPSRSVHSEVPTQK